MWSESTDSGRGVGAAAFARRGGPVVARQIAWLALVLAMACVPPAPAEPPTTVEAPPSRAHAQPATDAPGLAAIRIGGIFDLESAGEAGEDAMWEGAKLAVDEINQAGGVAAPAGARHPLELVVYDDEGRPDLTTLVQSRLVERDRVQALVAGSRRDAAGMAALLAGSARVPTIQLGSSESRAPSSPWLFSLGSTDAAAVEAIVDSLGTAGVERIGWIGPRTRSGERARATAVSLTEAKRIRIVAEEAYGLTESDLGERVARLAHAGAQALVGWPRAAEDAAAIARAVANRAPGQRLYLGPAAATDRFLTLAGDAAAGSRAAVPRLLLADFLWDHDPQTPHVRELIRVYRSALGHFPTREGALGWDAIHLLVAAFERGGTDPDGVRRALEQFRQVPAASGIVSFDTADRQGLDRSALLVARAVPGGWLIPP